ncbi:MAG: hypothetical protein ACFFAS_01895 [Promethearchaeota archaeon]
MEGVVRKGAHLHRDWKGCLPRVRLQWFHRGRETCSASLKATKGRFFSLLLRMLRWHRIQPRGSAMQKA